MREFKIVVFVAGLAIFVACGQTASNNPSNTATANAKTPANVAPTPAATVEMAAGGKLYSTSCAKCHKEDGSGGKITVDGKSINPDNLTSPKMVGKSDEKLLTAIADGYPDDGMPAFKDKLKPDEMKQIVAFIRSDIQKSAAKPGASPSK